MRCPNCQSEVRDGAVFCGSCGAVLPPAPVASGQPAAPAPVVPPVTQVVAPQPQLSVDQAEYERQMAEYRRKQAEYEQQTAGQTSPQPEIAPPVQYAQPGVASSPPKKKTGLIIGIVAAVVLVLGGLMIAGVLIARSAVDDAVENIGVELEAPFEEEVPVEVPAASAGYASAAEAVTAELQELGYGDWITQLYKEDSEVATYWAGPPNSEWVSELTVLKQADGTWTVERIEDIQIGGDVPMAPADEAVMVVTDFLVAIQQDRADDAHAMTIEPFSQDPASASYSNGEFTDFEIVSVEEQSDGTVWVQVSETWYGTADSVWYFVAPTEAGYRISSAEVR
ncbi:MAG: zinc ribbon domain-containing protein [Coriobacteriia bacterium]|nr:zinc ribbon domain-containing protein [Coriobacteriia bacterium]